MKLRKNHKNHKYVLIPVLIRMPLQPLHILIQTSFDKGNLSNKNWHFLDSKCIPVLQYNESFKSKHLKN